eukprot:CAMPEP_0113551402 /NCGR_PEP_ID=MMETSP0015_2-20120614/14505_1 /TAXON_ID=2838 /ORGANISM="Odontella" /LENGTH=329 /DNA_ID=CAMNT_0000452291 /DNA_START=354 /DNA_END=1340 /DNA_ORIENTATION=+ /assembly_acc=CAM_ASM_000160
MVLHAAKASPGAARRFVALSFSGAGHLLPYHLGCASALLRRSRDAASPSGSNRTIGGGGTLRGSGATADSALPPIEAVAGSSSGAIAAAALARLPHRVDEYADRFISEGGDALRILRDMLHEEERRESLPSSSSLSSVKTADVDVRRATAPSLHVAATRCSDGRLHLFSFPRDNGAFRSISAGWNTDRLLKCVEASCRIPQSFHPIDVTPGLFGRMRGNASYPEEEGVRIDGKSYVDGGIAAPAPPTPRDGEVGALRVIVSPISGSGSSAYAGENSTLVERVSPQDSSWNLLPMEIRCNGEFNVRPSVQNIRAMKVSMGAASEIELREW